MNCIIHQRDTFEAPLAELKPFARKVRGAFYCFAENEGWMRQELNIGSLASFTGIVTFKNGQNVRDTAATTPFGQFMLETDCPSLAPVPYRGKRCEPAYVKEIFKGVDQLKGCPLNELSATTCKTATEFLCKL